MSMFRSTDMNLGKVLVTKDKAYDLIEAIGMLNQVYFVNLNKDEQLQRLPFSREISKGNEICTKLDYIYEAFDNSGIKIKKGNDYKDFMNKKLALQKKLKVSKFSIIDNVRKTVEQQYQFLKEQNVRIEGMYSDYNDLLEYKQVMEASRDLLEGEQYQEIRGRLSSSISERDFGADYEPEEIKRLMNVPAPSEANSELNQSEIGDGVKVGRVVGTCMNDDLLRLERLLFRATRGNSLVLTKNTGGIVTLDKKVIPKSVFIVIFQEGEELRNKIETITQNFSKNKYKIPKGQLENKINKLKDRIEQTRQLIVISLVGIEKYLVNCNEDSKLDLSRRIGMHDSAIYQRLDYMHQSNNLFIGYFWSCKTHKEIDLLLSENNVNICEAQFEDGHIGNIPAPTYFKLNEFTSPFQEVVTTYGVPSYKEINPAYFTIVTFPFLFGVMFGDVGHGSFLLILAIILCFWDSFFKNNPQLKVLSDLRYMILLMGIFSTFGGVIYNDFMSIPMQFMSSCYTVQGETATHDDGGVYSFGVDYVWYQSENILDFMNSVKMKIAVILGVSHMTLGICMKGLNSRYFYKGLDYYFEFIPQLALMTVLFGYMNLLIIVKWCTTYTDTSQAPSIITTMIDMFLGMGAVEETSLLWSRTTQEIIQILILLTAFVCVPTMLLVKPLILTSEIRRKEASDKSPSAIELGVGVFKKRKMSEESDEEIKSESDDEDQMLIKREPNGLRKRFPKEENKQKQFYNPKEDPYSINTEKKKDDARDKLEEATRVYKQSDSHDLQEIWIHQLIETIEFVLGTISNTASYLRLWALSLAHSQLADVFYEKLIQNSVEKGEWYIMFFILPMYLTANFGILVGMDSMEGFLHTLRLHWVEFQNKFFKGAGYKFLTFSLVESTGFKNDD